MEIEKALKALTESSRLFFGFAEDEMLELLKFCASASFKKSQIIFRENSSGGDMYIIITGSVVIKKEGKTIDVIRVGECFGEMGALSGEKRSAAAEAAGDLVLLVINDAKLENLRAEIRSKLFRNILLIIAERLRRRIEDTVRGGNHER